MGNRWGSESHDPEGDPSWLGGKGRGRAGVGGPGSGGAADGGWSSDFTPDSAQTAEGRSVPEESAPRFGEFTGDQARSSRRTRQPQGRPSTKELISALVSIVVLIVIVFTFYRSGWNAWWLIFVVGIPLVRRIANLTSRYFGD